MSGKVNITIPKPCHENWHEMTVAEKGRFCNSCQKTVYDFTHFSNRQLIQKINSESNICGRFLASQLDKDLRVPKEKSSIWIAGVSGILSFLSLGNQEIYAQENVKTEQTEEKNNVEKTINNSSVPDIEITGFVFELDKLPLPGVSVTIEGKSISTKTDFDGKFSIKASKGDLLKFYYVGYKETSVTVNSKKPIIIKLEDTHEMLGEVYIVRKTFFGRIFHSIGNLFR
ncbi:carboxypeptidase-like regulatory domain-containing protein [Flavobacterium lindanitolerans]|uniref:carboxypeptidase-like regulatory domain-containing protein n=1 Tax=Flavobacterium lindanitolerans TaxID=428988 RepID=UPI0028081598|nr:carboxypeptidase-like regulatory domain-containing protein [Flavobacterium lindanitolerans]MDQ7961514.1 carboxypeptidase-like regulatory domain-containing protein [Flavobacterium lindanitolerans]